MGHIKGIVIVCVDGCHLVPELTHCLDKVVQFVNEKEPVLIIFCGGFRQQKSAPGTSEAALMYIYVRERISRVPLWIIEDDSYTTYDKIELAARAIRKMLPMRPELIHAEITIFCEATRALKVALLARYFIGFPPTLGRPCVRIETDSWELMHPFSELVATTKDVLAIYFPFLNTLHRNRRIKKSKTI